jgi:uncharacterized protein
MRKTSGQLVFSPSDLNRYLASPFASWMDRLYLENRRVVRPDAESDEQKLIAQIGDQHEATVLADLRALEAGLVEVSKDGEAIHATLRAIKSGAPVIYQAALECGRFSGFADFLMLNAYGEYQVWDTKLANSPKPYYAIQLCCYSEMLAATTGGPMPESFGIILGNNDRKEFRVGDFIHHYHRIKTGFLALQDGFTGDLAERPEPLPRADHGRWTSHAQELLTKTDHLVQVAGITTGQIQKLKRAGISTVAELAGASGKTVAKLSTESREKLVAQARLQCSTRE